MNRREKAKRKPENPPETNKPTGLPTNFIKTDQATTNGRGRDL
jgi:hypothetical protein